MGVWAPTFFTWMAVVFFDSQEMRNLMHEALHISFAGPYFLYWIGLGDYMIHADYSQAWYWIGTFVVVYSVCSMAYLAIFVPKISRWLTETPLKVYPDPLAIKPLAPPIDDVTFVTPDSGDSTEEVVKVVPPPEEE